MKLALFAVVLILFFATGVITLLAIIQRVEMEKKYLNALFTAFILELTVAVLVLFSGTDFFAEPQPVVAQDERILVLDDFFEAVDADELRLEITELLKRLDAQAEQQDLISGLESELSDAQRTIDEKNDQIKWLNKELLVRGEAVVRLGRLERQFLVRIAELNSKISEWGATINFRWKPEEKREVALMLQEAFKEIGFMKELEIPNDDPALAHDILVRYQKTKKFEETGFLTHQTVAFIVQDYLSAAGSQVR